MTVRGRMVRVNVIARCAAAAVLFAVAGCGEPSVPAPTETASTAPTVVATTRAPSTSPPASASSSAPASSHTTPRATTSAPPHQQAATTTTAARLTAARVIDGDTIVTSAGDTIRLAGIDTPERGQCGYSEATANLRRTLAGNTLTLTKAGLTDRDKYGRLIRYVDVGEQDAGMDQIMGGFARARYDSRDGYGRHPRQDDYVAADAATPSICAASTTQGAESTATKTAAAPAGRPTERRKEEGDSIMPARDRSAAILTRNARILAASDICHICGEPGADAIDHVIPLARGGADQEWNLRPAHHNTPNSAGIRCNRAKGARIPDVHLTTSRTW